MEINNFAHIVKSGLCLGCGACSYFAPDFIHMENIENIGYRPIITGDIPVSLDSDLIRICPGYSLDAGRTVSEEKNQDIIDLQIGNTKGLWVGWSADNEIRYKGSSGGLLTSLALFSLEVLGMDGVLHTKMDSKVPWGNSMFISRTREELLAASGSRYVPSTPVAALNLISEKKGRFCFIGKPCDTAAVKKIMELRPEIKKKIGLMLTFFCSGTPCVNATKSLIDKLGIDAEDALSIRYRGMGWPGNFVVTSSKDEQAITYEEAWGFLSRQYRQFRCNICPDGLGEFADISCGDAWYRKGEKSNDGCSMILSRSPKGHDIIQSAIDRGYIVSEIADKQKVILSQGPVERKGVVHARLSAMSFLGMALPIFSGFGLKRLSRNSGLKKNARNFIGMIIRYFRKKLGKPENESWK